MRGRWKTRDPELSQPSPLLRKRQPLTKVLLCGAEVRLNFLARNVGSLGPPVKLPDLIFTKAQILHEFLASIRGDDVRVDLDLSQHHTPQHRPFPWMELLQEAKCSLEGCIHG